MEADKVFNNTIIIMTQGRGQSCKGKLIKDTGAKCYADSLSLSLVLESVMGKTLIFWETQVKRDMQVVLGLSGV